MEDLRFENLHCTEAHVFNVSRQKSLTVNFNVCTLGCNLQGGPEKRNGRGLLSIFSKMLPLSCAEHVEYAL